MRPLVPFILIIAVLGALAAFNYYVFIGNETNHTGIPVSLFGQGLAVAVIFSGGITYTRRTGRRIWLALTLLMAFAAINVLALNWLHVMMDYDKWVHGMPDRPAWSLPHRQP